MKFKNITIIIINAAIVISSCTSLKRYSSVVPSGINNNLADIDLFAFRLTQAEPWTGNKSLWDLSADAQSQYIKILNSRYPDNEEFIKAMSFGYLKKEESAPSFDYASKELRMIFSVSKQRNYGEKKRFDKIDLSPADRIEYVKISLRIDDLPGLGFTNWNMFTTEYGSIELADVSFTRSLEIEASTLFSSDGKVTGGEASSSGKTSASRREDQEIKYRYIKLNGTINRNQIQMEEEGTREIDLTGNITADVNLEFDRFPVLLSEFTGLRDSTGKFNKPEKLRIKNIEATVPSIEKIHDTIYARLSMDYLFRNVVSGQKTFPEWDDRIRYYTGTVSKTIPLFTSKDYVPDFYCIGSETSPGKRELIRLSASGTNEFPLIFRSYTEASAFFEWLSGFFSLPGSRSGPVCIGGYTLRYMDEDLNGKILGNYPGMRIVPFYK